MLELTSSAQLRLAQRSSDYCLNQIGLVQFSLDEFELFGFGFDLVLVGCKSGLAFKGFRSSMSFYILIWGFKGYWRFLIGQIKIFVF